MKQKIRIEAEFAPFGTKVLNENGEELASKITSIEFKHRVGDVPRMVIERYATTTEIVGEAEVEIYSICPCCKKRLAEEASQPCSTRIGTAETTTISDEYKSFIASPVEN